MTEHHDVPTCIRCGRSRTADPPAEAMAWVVEREAGRTQWLCPSCAREHVRDIEGRLPAEHWF